MWKPLIPDDVFIDGNGLLCERVTSGGLDVVMHYDDEIPDSDLTVVDGLPCTTALRAVIDCAPDLQPHELEELVGECLERRLFTPEEAFERVARPDMLPRPGAMMLARALVERGHHPH